MISIIRLVKALSQHNRMTCYVKFHNRNGDPYVNELQSFYYTYNYNSIKVVGGNNEPVLDAQALFEPLGVTVIFTPNSYGVHTDGALIAIDNQMEILNDYMVATQEGNTNRYD